MSYTKDVVIYPELRPPVASIDGKSPLRGNRLTNILQQQAVVAASDPANAVANVKMIVSKYTDDGMLAPSDELWNKRHHQCPSIFNLRNHTHYRQYFDKQFQAKQPILLEPKRELDPYEQNEQKGTRMPDYTGVTKTRDIHGELGWIPNFNVKCSKNNDVRYPTNREFFDGPMNYHVTFNNSTMTNSEFFRQNAPPGSVARGKVQTLSVMNRSKYGSTIRSSQSTVSASLYSTPFILDRDVSNRWKNLEEVKKTQPFTNAIPFLRAPEQEFRKITRSPVSLMDANQTFTAGFSNNNQSGEMPNQNSNTLLPISRKRVKQMRRENAWDQYIKPISKYNAQVHQSMRITFEKI